MNEFPNILGTNISFYEKTKPPPPKKKLYIYMSRAINLFALLLDTI